MAAFILIGSSSAIAQSTVIGKVVDENDAPLIGATVIVPGTSTGTGTDAAGNFSLKVDAGTQSVEISFIGYVTETREIKGSSGRPKQPRITRWARSKTVCRCCWNWTRA
mgnify:CR=1 FL=1